MSDETESAERWSPPLWLVLVITAAMFAVGALWKVTCSDPFTNLCYSDIPALYGVRGLIDGIRVYLDMGGDRYLEYPVLTGTVMQISAWITRGLSTDNPYRAYVVVNSFFLLGFALITTASTWFTRARNAWMGPVAALMIAASPLMILDSTINWDLVAVAFAAMALAAWSREAPLLTGMFLGLGASAKLYPIFILGPLVVLCAREGRWRDAVRASLAAVVAWLVVNVPVMLLNFDGWKEFYVFSQSRGVDFGSVWLALREFGVSVPPTAQVNTLSTALFIAACVGIAVLAWIRPSASLAQLGFLVVAAFVLVNKVYSPQYALWLLPLAALARPRWPAMVVWQLGEVVYFVAIWRLLLGYGQLNSPPGSISERAYVWAIVLHVVLTVGYAALVVRDVLRDRDQDQMIASARVVV